MTYSIGLDWTYFQHVHTSLKLANSNKSPLLFNIGFKISLLTLEIFRVPPGLLILKYDSNDV